MGGHKFDPGKARRLDSAIRRALLAPGKILTDTHAEGDGVWADIGCGTGFWTLPLARRVRKVYALDINSAMLAELGRKLAERAVENVETMPSGESSLPLGERCLDGVLLAFVAHELDEPAHYFAEIRRVLKPGGRLIVIEHGQRSRCGPPPRHRLSPRQLDRWARDAGLDKGLSWDWSRGLLGWKFIDVVGLEYIRASR